MLRILAAIFVAFSAIVGMLTPFAALILYMDWRHSLVGDPRRASWRTIRNSKIICVVALASLLFMALSIVAVQARTSPYPGVTPFNGDKYGSAQLGPEVARDVQRQRAAKKLNRRGTAAHRKRPPGSRKHWDGHPMPKPRPGTVERLSMVGGVQREAGRVILGGRPAGCPHRFCGCALSLHLFGKIVTAPNLNKAIVWAHAFPRTSAAPGMVAVRSGHVFKLLAHVKDKVWRVWDANSGRGRIRIHDRSIAGYTIVDPRGA